MHKILAIDDKMDNLITLSALLKNLMPDCVVITAQSGMEGIKKAMAELPDVILLDVKMPEMDGFETCRRLMADEITKRIPVIMITAIKTDPQSRIKGLEIGANTFLAKPIDHYELVSQVKVALRIKEAEDALRLERNSLERMVETRTSSLRQSEDKYQQLVENISDVIFELNGEGLVTYVSPALKDAIGYDQDEVIGKNFIVFVHPEDQSILTKRFLELGTGVEYPLDYRLMHKSGAIRWVRIKTRPIMEERRFAGARGTLIDITDQRLADEKLLQTLESLRKSHSTIIQVMVSAVEARDPYTSGHQNRSANIACAIAAEMGLSQEKIEGIHMAGSIHDIGKLSIPTEILSKPTRLSEIEFSLIKEHSKRGYEILKDIESPWPLAEIVYQHHERMNGSGYPRNLKGDEILMEARIMAVADVVESMASHRPYRPALGINAALEEIENNKETLYDTDVADACLRLFRKKGFQIANA